MNKIFKKIFIAILIIMFLLAFSKSYSTLNVDNLSVVVAMGLDVSDKKNLKISFQFTIPLLSQNQEHLNNHLLLFIQ